MPTKIVDDEMGQPCLHQEHNPPKHIVIPQGKKIVHTCPACGKVTEIRADRFYYFSYFGKKPSQEIVARNG